MTWRPEPPAATSLTRAQHDGYRCCWCHADLTGGARSAGRAKGSIGAYDMSIEVYECGPKCPRRPRRPKRTPETTGQKGTP
ncbi:hypothetical protein [Streptomyces chartreusis]|uniref:hypothetical protein n=1 Tax=Streptomyces chartreusis TaxID=1969 RepID=UPI00381E9C7E